MHSSTVWKKLLKQARTLQLGKEMAVRKTEKYERPVTP